MTSRITSTLAKILDRLATLGWGLMRTLRLPPRSMATTLRVAALMSMIELMVRTVPLPRVASILGVRLDLTPSPVDGAPVDFEMLPEVSQRQITCTNRVADVWPFSDGPCLRRTLVAGRLLRRHEPSMRVGLRGADAQMIAHAWLEIGGQPLEDVSDIGVFAVHGTGPG